MSEKKISRQEQEAAGADSKKKKKGGKGKLIIGGAAVLGVAAFMALQGGGEVQVEDGGDGPKSAAVSTISNRVDTSVQEITGNEPDEIKRQILEEEKRRAQEAAKRGESYVSGVQVAKGEVDLDFKRRFDQLQVDMERLRVRNEELSRQLMAERDRYILLERRYRSLKAQASKSGDGDGSMPIMYMEVGDQVLMDSRTYSSINKSVAKTVQGIGSMAIAEVAPTQVSFSPSKRKNLDGTPISNSEGSSATGGGSTVNSSVGAQSGSQTDLEKLGLRPGDMAYGILLTDANTDVPGPVLVELQGGELSGARLVGRMSVQNQYMVLKFNSLVMPDGARYQVEAMAIDPYTLKYNVEDERDRHVLLKMAAIFGAAWLQGIGEAAMRTIELKAAIAQQQATVAAATGTPVSTTNTVDMEDIMLSSVGKIGSMLGQMLQPYINKPDTITKYAQSDVGIVFIK